MKNIKKAYIILGTTILSISAFTGCNTTDNSSVVSAFSDSVIEIEIPEPADSLNEGQAIDREDGTEIEGANGTSEDIELPGEIIEGSALTKEEIEALVASAPDVYKSGIEGYQQIMEEGSWKVPGQGGQSIISEVVGKPGDTSWRQMTDEEAQAYKEQYKYSVIGDAELMNGTWNSAFKGKLYFNPYEYEKAMEDSISQQEAAGEFFTEADIE